MKYPAIADNEPERLRALKKTGLLDTAPEARFDRLTRLASQALDLPVALVSLVDEQRQWFKSAVGLEVPETSRAISFCGHAIHSDDTMVIPDARLDPRFKGNPLLSGDKPVIFYAGAPLHSKEGHRLGTLCVIDHVPRGFSDREKGILRDIADCVEREIHAREVNALYREVLESERRAHAVIEGTRVGTWEWNIRTGEATFNSRWAEICGYTLEELAPLSIDTWRSLCHPDDLPESVRRLEQHFAGKADRYNYRCRMRHKNGQWIWVHDRGQVLEWTSDGQPLWMYGTHADVSREMEQLDRLNQQNTAFRILNDLAMTSERDELALINRALRRGRDFLGQPTAIVSEITSNVYTVRWCQSELQEYPEPGTTFPLGDTYCSLLLNNRAPLAISDMGHSQYRDQRCYQLFGLEAYIAAPIHVGGKLFGTLNFSALQPRRNAFTDTEVTFVTLLARWIANAIERQVTSSTLAKLAEQAPGTLYQYRLWPDGSSTFPYASPGMLGVYGVAPEEVASDASIVFERIHPDDLQRIAESIEVSATHLTTWQEQYRVASGQEWRWVEGRATPERLPDDSTIWHGYITDIHDHKGIELALKESEEQFRRLFEKSPIGIMLAELRSGKILDMNDALLRPSGYQREEIRNLQATGFFQNDSGTVEEFILQPLRDSGRFGPIERNILRKDGSSYTANIQGIRINTTFGEPLVWVLVEDISERKRVERMKNEFISTVSHELRTPLTSLAGSLRLISSGVMGPIPEQQKSLIEIAARNSEQLKLLINDLLDMEKLVAGRLEMEITNQPVAPLVQDTIGQMRTYAVEQGITLRCSDGSADAPAPVDARRFRQALNNLLSNAIKFSPQNSTVEVTIRVDPDALRVVVADQGPGIPEPFRERVFEKFAQADSSDTRGQGGTGLGLAITREIMEQMGGGVDFETGEGQGSVFWLTLPGTQKPTG
ncbi:PAS domain-containing protein [Marinobacter sp.]|uniref:PAS domain-containing protein n=1 Tax=Marinobacter sp. TaxID=50741 RepID=UPI0019C52F2F|nr:PAS domain-containing protein [Marinobacter sp.]MBC7191185.1 PAS domain-containing protein [Marinobacter sp.]